MADAASAPTILVAGEGFHNADLDRARTRLGKSKSYQDLSTVCVMPIAFKVGSVAALPVQVVQAIAGLMAPMNQKFTRIFMWNMEVGAAYSAAVEMILANPELSKWKYMLTMEQDNIPPPDGLLKLYEAIEGGVDGVRYDVVQGLYWTKGEGGQPMIYGNPNEPLNFIPQRPIPNAVQPARGLGMGFNLFRISLFRDPNLPKPYFKTVQEYAPGVGTKGYSQDLYFYENAGRLGYRFACDNRVKVGHLDVAQGIVW